ncbi:MAG TPA: hypothetical protein VJS68_03480, partial [Thermoplasmata archaeon]|nr:hypothetical protein [Thermoplasmata archaeon]
ASCDSWLKGFLSPMLNSTSSTVQHLMAHTAFFVVYDEGSTNLGYSVGGIVNNWCKNTTGRQLTVCGGHVYLAAISPFSLGKIYVGNATDYNLESTVEWLFGLGGDGGYDGTANFPAMTGLFSFAHNGVLVASLPLRGAPPAWSWGHPPAGAMVGGMVALTAVLVAAAIEIQRARRARSPPKPGGTSPLPF